MVEAGQTTVAPAGIWAIAVVAVLLLGFWLTAVMLADRSQARASGRARMAGEALPASEDAWASGSVPGQRSAEIPQGEVPTRADMPAQPAAGQPTAAGLPTMPRQRTGDADRAARSDAGRDTADDEERGR
jgi:hypothetical protein